MHRNDHDIIIPAFGLSSKYADVKVEVFDAGDDMIHYAWELDSGHVVCFEFITGNSEMGYLFVRDSVYDYLTSIPEDSFITDNAADQLNELARQHNIQIVFKKEEL